MSDTQGAMAHLYDQDYTPSQRPAPTIPKQRMREAIQKVANERQEGGSHYLHFAIQPIDFIAKNNLGWHQGNIVKYICRYPFKGGVSDLLKAKDYLDKLIEEEEAKAGA